MFLGHIVNKLVKVCLGMTKESDRDSYLYKRVDISGFLMANLFRDYYNQFRQTVRNNIDRQYLFGPWRNLKNIVSLVNKSNLSYVFQSQIIDDGMRKSLKGNWGVNMVEEQQDQDDIKQGLVQDLSRISYLGFISHLRRVNTPIDPTSKIVAPHRLHPSQWGVMCPCESPDGASIGLLKNFAILCKVTFDGNATSIMECLKDQGMILLSDLDVSESHIDATKVILNNTWVGVHTQPAALYETLRLLKRNAMINIYTSISWDVLQNEISVLTEAGRCCRPVYVVDTNGSLLIEKYIDDLKQGKLTWMDLITGCRPDKFNFDGYTQTKSSQDSLKEKQAPIEYIDVEEANHSLIAMDSTYLASTKSQNQKYDYCELHPSTIFSVVTHNIPLANHNQAPRNIFSGAQGKQAIGCYATNFNNRIDTMAYILHYPQKCLVNTRYCEYLNLNRVPNGENLIVAIATYSGYNMEDSIIMNKTSVERGMFNVTYYKSHIEQEEENKHDNERITFHNPHRLLEASQPLHELKWGSYQHLDKNGFPLINTYVEEGHAIIGKVKVKTELVEDETIPNNIFNTKVKREVYYDRSVIADKTMSGKIDKVFVYMDEQNNKTCKIRFRKMRLPELGDKCCCYDDTTEILTEHGWKLFKDLTIHDKVASMVDDALIYQHPTHIQHYHVEGSLYKVQNDQVNLFVTDNHRMYVDEKIMEAKDIYRRVVRYKKNIRQWTPDLKNAPSELVIDKHNNRIIGFMKHDNVIVDIDKWLTHFGTLQSMMEVTGFPEWVWYLDRDQCKTLIYSILLETKQYTSSSIFADQFQRLCLHAGFSSNKISLNDGWMLSVIDEQNEPIVNKYSMDDSWEDYKGDVWCCTVSKGEGIVYVRREGVVVWCGQSKHAQKGVIGMLVPQEDMPFTQNGIVPDIIINPHAIPSRMTVGHLLEMLLGKVGACAGSTIDGTPFNNNDYEDLYHQLEKSYGFERHGNEVLYNGQTGAQIETNIFIGPIFYERLKHMVADKINYRQVNFRTITSATDHRPTVLKEAPVSAMTRQPTKGRGNNGGLRIGEMEKDTILSHGMVNFLKESMMERSDLFEFKVDSQTRMIADDKGSTHVSTVKTPFAFKQLLHELVALGIKPELNTAPEDDDDE
jgi:DNA-directed RNA polymerase beta subunit